MPTKTKRLLRYKEIASRLNGVQIPIFGVQWVPAEPERKVVRDVLTFFEDRRVLYNDYAFELEHEVIESALRIREVLTDAIQRLGEDSKAAPAMRAMRVAARQFFNRPRDRGMYLVSGDLGLDRAAGARGTHRRRH